MTPERFRQLEELYHAAREKTGEERAALLAEADPELRREIETLLDERTADEFLDQHAIHNMQPGKGPMKFGYVAGDLLGPYRIESKLGEGGMGEVFEAVDTRLDRAVAVKTAREEFSDRFEREARSISALNHPHICTLYDVGPNYLVMELVEGETIAERLKRGPLPEETALLYASQIAAALTEAHGKGIVHRDLKPANIMIAKSGIKVLDFGLAKSDRDETVTAARMVMGTPAYMAPEQREGKPADARSDIYAFGHVLCEMLTGARAGSQRRTLPRGLERIVSRCLEEDPDRRWQSAAELERGLASVTPSANRTKTMISAAAVIFALLAAAYFYFQRAPKLTATDTIVLADFDNKTGDPVFDETLRHRVLVELQRSALTVISDQRVQREMTLMGQPKSSRVTADLAQQICVRTASVAVLEGSIAQVGSQYVLGLRAKNCRTGSILDQEQVEAARREEVLSSLSQMIHKFRTTVGESLATMEKPSAPLAAATTPSLEALQAYTAGLKASVTSGNPESIPFYRRAVEIDPQFAMAHAHLGLAYSATGQPELSADSTMKGWRLRDRVSDREKFFIDFAYARQVTGNLEKAYEVLELWRKTYPRGEYPNPYTLLGGVSTHGTGRYEIAIQASEEGLAVDPDYVFGYGNLAWSYFLTDRFGEVERTLRRAAERKLSNPGLLVIRYNLGVLKGDQAEADRAVALAKGKPGMEHWLAHEKALALARSGRLQAARQVSSQAVDQARQEGKAEPASCYQAARAVWEAVFGNMELAQKSAAAALEISRGRDVEYASALALALSGESSRSDAIIADLEKRVPEDTFVKFTYAPVLRALGELRRGRPEAALDRLQIALRYELAANGLNFGRLYLGGLHSAFVRGQALIGTGRNQEAAAEFQKIVDHRGIVALDPIGAIAHLQLGRAHALAGDKAKAKSAYDRFFALWEHADPHVPLLKQAKTEYASLQ